MGNPARELEGTLLRGEREVQVSVVANSTQQGTSLLLEEFERGSRSLLKTGYAPQHLAKTIHTDSVHCE